MTVVLQSVSDVYQRPFVCKWFAFGLVFRNLAEFFLLKFRNLFGIVVDASPVQFN